MTTEARNYLRGLEWSMTACQCLDCGGKHPSWYGHPCARTTLQIGHKPDCRLAAALRSLGETPLMLGDYAAEPAQMNWIYTVRSTS